MSQLPNYQITANPVSTFETYGEGAPAAPAAMPGTPAAPVVNPLLGKLASLSETAAGFFAEKERLKAIKGVKEGLTLTPQQELDIAEQQRNNNALSVASLVDKGIMADNENPYVQMGQKVAIARLNARMLAADLDANLYSDFHNDVGKDQKFGLMTGDDPRAATAAYLSGKIGDSSPLTLDKSFTDDYYYSSAFEKEFKKIREATQQKVNDLRIDKQKADAKAGIEASVVDALGEQNPIDAMNDLIKDGVPRAVFGNEQANRIVGDYLLNLAVSGDAGALKAIEEIELSSGAKLFESDDYLKSELAKQKSKINRGQAGARTKELQQHDQNAHGAIMARLQEVISGVGPDFPTMLGNGTSVPNLMYMPGDMTGDGYIEAVESVLPDGWQVSETQDGISISTTLDDGTSHSREFKYSTIHKTAVNNVAASMTEEITQSLVGDTNFLGSILGPEDREQRERQARATAEAQVAVELSQMGYKSKAVEDSISRAFSAAGDIRRYPSDSEQYFRARQQIEEGMQSAMTLMLSDQDGSTLGNYVDKTKSDYLRGLFLYAYGEQGARVGDFTATDLFFSKPPSGFRDASRQGDSETAKALNLYLEKDRSIGVTRDRLDDLSRALQYFGNMSPKDALESAFTTLQENSTTIGGYRYYKFDFGPGFLDGSNIPTLMDGDIVKNRVNGQRLLNEFVLDLNESGLDHGVLTEGIADGLYGFEGDQGMLFQIRPEIGRPGHFTLRMNEEGDSEFIDFVSIPNPKREDGVFTTEDIVSILKERGKINEYGNFTVDRTGMDEVTDEQRRRLSLGESVPVGELEILIPMGGGTAIRMPRTGSQGMFMDETPQSRQERNRMSSP